MSLVSLRDKSAAGPQCQRKKKRLQHRTGVSKPPPSRPPRFSRANTWEHFPQETGWRLHKWRFLTVKAIGCVSLCAQVPVLPLDARAARAARVAKASTVAVKVEVKSEARLARQVCVLDIPCCQCFRQRLGPPTPGCLDAICEI